MMKRYLAAAVVAATLAVPTVSTPAFATHTLCDNEGSDTYIRQIEVGADTDDAPGTVYICVGMQLLVIRTNGGQQTYCSYYDWHNPSTRDCVYFG